MVLTRDRMGKGLRDWLLQRMTAIVLFIYFVFLTAFFFSKPTYVQWKTLFYTPVMKMATFVALLSLMVHAWIGVWTVTTDYLRNIRIRFSVQVIVFLALLMPFIFGVKIIFLGEGI